MINIKKHKIGLQFKELFSRTR